MLQSVSPSTVTSALSRFVNSMESHLKYKQHFKKKVKLILNFTWSRKYRRRAGRLLHWHAGSGAPGALPGVQAEGDSRENGINTHATQVC